MVKNTYSAPGAKIGKNLSKPKEGWGRDEGSRPGRPDEGRRHVGDGGYRDFQSREWNGDEGNVHPED